MPWTPQEETKLISLFGQKTPLSKISSTLQKPLGTIKTKLFILRKKGLVGTLENKWTSEQDEILLSKREQGVGVALIAVELNRSYKSCMRRLVALNVRERKQYNTVFETLKNLVKARKSKQEIMEELSIDEKAYKTMRRRLDDKNPNHWRRAEQNVLLHNVQLGKTAAEVAKILGRTESGCRAQLAKLNKIHNTVYTFYSPFFNPWLPEQDAILEHYCFGTYTKQDTVLMTGHSENAITARLTVLRYLHGAEKYPKSVPNQYIWSQGKDDLLIQLVSEGTTRDDITKKLGVVDPVWKKRLDFLNSKYGTNYQYKRKTPVREAKKPWTYDDDRDLRKIIWEGLTFVEAGVYLGRTKNACISRFHKMFKDAEKLVEIKVDKPLNIANYSKSTINEAILAVDSLNIAATLLGVSPREILFIRDFAKGKQNRAHSFKAFCSVADCWNLSEKSVYCAHHHSKFFIKQKDYKRAGGDFRLT